MNVKVQLLHPIAVLPRYATDGAGCFDLETVNEGVVLPNQPLVVGTGLAFEIPRGYVMLVYSRSGHGFKSDVRLANCVGVIDSDYRGEVMVKLTLDGNKPYAVFAGDRIAQAMIVPVPNVSFEEVADLSTTSRGSGGLGSTGT